MGKKEEWEAVVAECKQLQCEIEDYRYLPSLLAEVIYEDDVVG